MYLQSLFAIAPLFSAMAQGAAIAIENNGDNLTLVERATKPPTHHVCGGRWGSSGRMIVSQEIQYWSQYTSDADICADAGKCERQWCRNGVRLGYCNDNNFRKCVYKDDIETRFKYTETRCPNTGGNGQTFYPDNTNVIIQVC